MSTARDRAALRLSGIWRLAGRALDRIVYRWSDWRVHRGVRVGLFLVRHEPAMAELCFGKVTSGLDLIAAHSPRRFAHLSRDVRQLWIGSLAQNAIGQWWSADGTCGLHQPWVANDSTSPERVAGTIVHEAMHARLGRLGVRDQTNERCERACWRAELTFLRRLPGQTEHVDSLRRVLDSGVFRSSPDAALQGTRRRIQEVLEEGGLPAWLEERLFGWLDPTRRRR